MKDLELSCRGQTEMASFITDLKQISQAQRLSVSGWYCLGHAFILLFPIMELLRCVIYSKYESSVRNRVSWVSMGLGLWLALHLGLLGQFQFRTTFMHITHKL